MSRKLKKKLRMAAVRYLSGPVARFVLVFAVQILIMRAAWFNSLHPALLVMEVTVVSVLATRLAMELADKIAEVRRYNRVIARVVEISEEARNAFDR